MKGGVYRMLTYDVGIVRIFKYSSYLINYRIINDLEN